MTTLSLQGLHSQARVEAGSDVVQPFHADTQKTDRPCAYVLKMCRAVSRWLYGRFDRLPGQFTVSKLACFDRFRRETSPNTVAAILFLTPFPCLLFNLLIECIPLNDPATGLRGSGCFQVRMFWSGFFTSLSPALIKVNCVPDMPVNSPRVLLQLATFQALVYLATNAVISVAADIFPVPFNQFCGIVPMVIVGRILFYRHLPKDPQFHAQSNKINFLVTVEILPVLIYPAFTVAFMALSQTQQFWASCLLPVLKITMRRVFWTITKDDSDFTAFMVCCVGHLYHVLFIAMILQNSKSLKTMGIVVLLGVGKMLLNCRYILNDARKIQGAKSKLVKSDEVVGDEIGCALRIALEPAIARELHNKIPSQLLSTYPGYCRTDFLARYEDVLPTDARSPVSGWTRLSRVLPWSETRKLSRQITLRSDPAMTEQPAVEATQTLSTPSAWVAGARDADPNVHREHFVCNVASGLHQSEIIVLRSCISIYMTLFYVIYLVAVFWLPNRRYFATQAAMTTFQAVGDTASRLLLLCAMELAFMGIYLALIARHLHVSGMYQLAFVLWSQRVLVQATLLHLTVAILGFPLAQFGNDKLLPLRPSRAE